MFLFRICKTQLSVKVCDFFEFCSFLSGNFVTFRLNEFLHSCGANIDMDFIVQKNYSVRDIRIHSNSGLLYFALYFTTGWRGEYICLIFKSFY